ncbi:hypothetical protein Patl1_09348 [Pistacia atlantica]|uniref:Uncharacterized protein n=1 Tax=Pistacia atlantica TaxID=434234 RepID=A0ACC1ALL5_9ROSI|nr:hypothetical protein Patl1_09348 [Pistacia atlantica]
MQGFGILASSMVTMVVCKIFERASNASSDQTPDGTDIAWRLILMLGSIPAALTYYWRMMMPETARYTALVEQNVLQAAKDMEKVLDVSMSQIAEEFPLSPRPPSYNLLSRKFIRQHGRDLFACSTSWFLLDIVFYSSNLFQSKIYHNYVDDDSRSPLNAFEEAFSVARLQAIVAICSTVPGAIGKVGAIIGSVGLLWVLEEDKKTGDPKATGMTIALILLGGVCFMGMAVTYFFTRETMGRSLEENENEDDSSELCFVRCFNDCCLRTNSSTNEGDEAPLAIEQL